MADVCKLSLTGDWHLAVDYESHHVLFILFDYLLLQKRDFTLSCFYSVYLAEYSTLEDILCVQRSIREQQQQQH